jgi:transcriptional regulator with XRE-family HTH domain
MMTAGQIRAARALLRWSAAELAAMSGLSERTLQRMEATEGIPAGLSRNLELVQKTLEGAGIIFIDSDELGPGVRLRDPNELRI